MKAITGINHLTLAVRDLSRSIEFYSDLLGFDVRMREPASAYLETGSLWLALVVDQTVRNGPLPEYTHVALSIADEKLKALAERSSAAGIACWQETERQDPFYFLDPDGHKFELHSGNLSSRLASRALAKQRS
jgi:catechol 2,3-dioxygenase-like lactoylglutathione lyase family enzyme